MSAPPSYCLCWSPSHQASALLLTDFWSLIHYQIMNRCNKPTPYHVFFLSHHTSSCWPHCTETCTNLYHEDQMLLLAGLHLLHLHVPVITTHLRTGRGGAMMGRTARPLDAAPCNCPVSPSPLTLPTHILGVADQSAGGRGRGGHRSICTNIVLA